MASVLVSAKPLQKYTSKNNGIRQAAKTAPLCVLSARAKLQMFSDAQGSYTRLTSGKGSTSKFAFARCQFYQVNCDAVGVFTREQTGRRPFSESDTQLRPRIFIQQPSRRA